jgi:hypothetical protein
LKFTGRWSLRARFFEVFFGKGNKGSGDWDVESGNVKSFDGGERWQVEFNLAGTSPILSARSEVRSTVLFRVLLFIS